MSFPEDLHKKLKLWCVEHDTEMGKVIRHLVEEFLKEAREKKKK